MLETKLICDRCGVNITEEFKKLGYRVLTTKRDPVDNPKDLCEQCSNDFDRWIKQTGRYWKHER